MTADPYGDARLVALYDDDNPDGPDHDWYRALADDLDARTVVDLGCGTGILTVTLARPGRTVLGVDPSPSMLAHARSRPGGDAVRWILGDSRAVGEARADLAVLTGNVAQHVLGDAWPRTLRDLHAALRPGGTLAFESRNPAARAWETWAGEPVTRQTRIGALSEWMVLTGVTDDEVALDAHTVFEASGEHLTSTLRLAFRTPDRLAADLAAAGFDVVAMTGGWDGRPLEDTSPLVVTRAVSRA